MPLKLLSKEAQSLGVKELHIVFDVTQKGSKEFVHHVWMQVNLRRIVSHLPQVKNNHVATKIGLQKLVIPVNQLN